MDALKIILAIGALSLVSACDTNNYSTAEDTATTNTSTQIGTLVGDDFFITFSEAQPTIFSDTGAYTATDIRVTINANDFNDLRQTNFSFPVKFVTSWGSFDTDECDIGSEGTCTVNWYSGSPAAINNSSRPTCEVAFTAYALGEEFFVDANDDGLFNSGETLRDLPEPFLDVDQNGAFTASGFELIDIAEYSNGTKNGVYDAADGRYNGSLCDDRATNNQCSNTTSAIIWTQSFMNVVDDGVCIQ